MRIRGGQGRAGAEGQGRPHRWKTFFACWAGKIIGAIAIAVLF